MGDRQLSSFFIITNKIIVGAHRDEPGPGGKLFISNICKPARVQDPFYALHLKRLKFLKEVLSVFFYVIIHILKYY